MRTARPYDLFIGEGLYSGTGKLCREVNNGQRALIVSDSHVAPLYAKEIAISLDAAGYQTGLFTFPAGEANKRLETIAALYGRLAAGDFTRSDLIVALGGGVTGDMAGFAAATWLRGIDFVQIPTSLLAQVDSSVGGKTGVDIAEGKNLVGAFWQPARVIADTGSLNTLPPAFITDGLGEVVKYACIRDAELFGLLEQGNVLSEANRERTITRCIDCKSTVVERDERESGERKLLNFGHTLGHALEKYYRYSGPTHGCAVAVGMAVITEASELRGLTAPGTAKRLKALLEKLGLPASDQVPVREYLPGVALDKKRTGSAIDLVLLHEIGDAFVYRIPVKELADFMGCAKA